MVRKPDRVKLLGHWGKPGVYIDRFFADRRAHPDQTEPFKGGKFDKTQLFLVDVAKPLGLRQATQVAIQIVGPFVIGTGQRFGFATFPISQTGAAMAADVHESFDLTVIVSCHQNRHAGVIMGKIGTRFRKLLVMPDNDWEFAKQSLHFLTKDVRVGVVGHWVAHHLGLQVGAAFITMLQRRLDDFDFFDAWCHV